MMDLLYRDFKQAEVCYPSFYFTEMLDKVLSFGRVGCFVMVIMQHWLPKCGLSK